MSVSNRSLPKLTFDGEEIRAINENIIELSVELDTYGVGYMMATIQTEELQSSESSSDNASTAIENIDFGTEFSADFERSQSQSSAESMLSSGSTSEEPMLSGEVTSCGARFSDSTPAHVIEGKDSTHRLCRGTHNRAFEDVTYSDIVRTIIREAGIKEGQIDPSEGSHKYVYQRNQTNFEFIHQLALEIGFEFYIKQSSVYFRKSKEDKVIPLREGEDGVKLNIRASSDGQVSKVVVTSWSSSECKLLTAERPTTTSKESPTPMGGLSHGAVSESFGKGCKSLRNTELHLPQRQDMSQDALEKLAQVIWDDLGKQFITADGECKGNEEIVPGASVEVQGFGKKYDGVYYVTQATHTYNAESVYTTEFSISSSKYGNLIADSTGVNSSEGGVPGGGAPGGGAPGSVSDCTAKPSSKIGKSPMIGIVTNNEDPEGLGRVKVMLPTLTEQHESNWAKVVSIGGGESCGIEWLPEIDDEVLVVFADGDIHSPYVLGGLWSNKNTPPCDQGEVVGDGGEIKVVLIKTRCANEILRLQSHCVEIMADHIKLIGPEEITFIGERGISFIGPVNHAPPSK